jgi:transcriptional regulator with XRE-family HTH domain
MVAAMTSTDGSIQARRPGSPKLIAWGQRVRERRGAESQDRLAARAHVSQANLSRLERGELLSVTDALKGKLAKALGCEIDDLFPHPKLNGGNDFPDAA